MPATASIKRAFRPLGGSLLAVFLLLVGLQLAAGGGRPDAGSPQVKVSSEKPGAASTEADRSGGPPGADLSDDVLNAVPDLGPVAGGRQARRAGSPNR